MSVRAQVIAAFSEDMVVTLIVCSAIAALWAGFRPDMVRDSEGRRLPPSLTARLTFVALFVIGFLALTMAFHFGGVLAKRLSSITGFGANFFGRFDGQAPILALLATSGLYSLAPFRELEQHFLAWIHSTRHLRGDVRLLTRHLEECGVTATSEERRRNIESLEAYDVYVTDVDTKPINLSSVTTWRKTASLLRQLRDWSTEKPRILSDEELATLAELEKSHTRKTRLAMDIIRMLEHMREGGDTAKALSGVTQILASASHSNRREVSHLEEQAQANLQGSGSPGERPVRLSSDELREYLKKIEGYFHVEYRLMLEQVADLAAKAILRAGDQAPQRLADLKVAGFEGLGAIDPLSAHRIIWFLLSIAVGGFLIYYLSWFDEAMRRVQVIGQRQGRVFAPAELVSVGRTFLIGIAVFVSSIALASLVGALFASNNAHVRARETPWGTYVLAGLVAVLAFAVMQLMREAVTLSLDATLAADLKMPADPVARIKNFAPWAVLPFLTAVGICRLARQNPWQPRLRDKIGANGAALLERLVDGLIMGLLMLPGFALALGIIQISGMQPSAILKPGFDPEVARNLFVFGFFVGALVIRDVRSAAHAQIVEVVPSKRSDVQSVVPFARAAA